MDLTFRDVDDWADTVPSKLYDLSFSDFVLEFVEPTVKDQLLDNKDFDKLLRDRAAAKKSVRREDAFTTGFSQFGSLMFD